jgi:hypothetical protein
MSGLDTPESEIPIKQNAVVADAEAGRVSEGRERREGREEKESIEIIQYEESNRSLPKGEFLGVLSR